MLTKMVRRSLLAFVSSSEFLEQIAVGLIGTERFYLLVRDEIENILTSKTVERIVRSVFSDIIEESLRNVVIDVSDNDIIILPDAGISDGDFERLARVMPRNKTVGLIAANDVKLLRLS